VSNPVTWGILEVAADWRSPQPPFHRLFSGQTHW